MATNKRLFLIFHGRYPSEKAASIFAAQSAKSFAGEGYVVTLLVPRRFGRSAVVGSAPFRIVYLPTIDLFPLRILQRVAFRISLFFFSFAAIIFLLLHANKDDIIYSNETLPLFYASFFFSHTTYEMHDYPESSHMYYKIFFRHIAHVLVTNTGKLNRFAHEFQEVAARAFYEPNAVDTRQFSNSLSRNEARERLGLPPQARLVIYTGHLYSWKGVDILAKAAKMLPEVLVYIVGGTERDLAEFRAKWGQEANIKIVGHRPHNEMPLWQRAADVLVLPNTAKEEISAQYTSPMKLFEYMASGTPIVASDLPSIREIAGDGRATLVTPDDPRALAQSVLFALKNGGTSTSERALAWVADHTWEKRAERILKSIS